MEEVLGIRNGITANQDGKGMCHRCRWCYNLIWINPKQIKNDNEDNYIDVEELRNYNKIFCCEECKEEDKDYNYLLHYKNNLEGQRRRDAIKREKRLLNNMK